MAFSLADLLYSEQTIGGFMPRIALLFPMAVGLTCMVLMLALHEAEWKALAGVVLFVLSGLLWIFYDDKEVE